MGGIAKQFVNIEVDDHISVVSIKSIFEGLVATCDGCLSNPVIT
jgi:hypothetical protein